MVYIRDTRVGEKKDGGLVCDLEMGEAVIQR